MFGVPRTKTEKVGDGKEVESERAIKGAENCYASYNAAPTRFYTVAYNKHSGKQSRAKVEDHPEKKDEVKIEVEAMKWGMLIPHSNDLIINGRLDELAQKPFFRGLLETNRCVIAVQGYYEWIAKTKQPYLIKPGQSAHTGQTEVKLE